MILEPSSTLFSTDLTRHDQEYDMNVVLVGDLSFFDTAVFRRDCRFYLCSFVEHDSIAIPIMLHSAKAKIDLLSHISVGIPQRGATCVLMSSSFFLVFFGI